ncbi:MAG: class I SAM-dependent methyltransferase [Betaproteobacteria bacterium]|nr:class I SAM-dependent methyltransferase [Betaproteobacteria bacterium]NBT05955.1 class I SAM-dependent methyltransferase [Betaproteobacteria bacterium]NDE54444.1 class I SAM-dependent methyltransferase [Actinomycetota bacterium]
MRGSASYVPHKKKDRAVDEDEEWIKYRERFSEVYDKSNYSSLFQRLAMQSSHKLLERPILSSHDYGMVIEVGAGTGEHLRFVRHRFDEYVLTDQDSKALSIASQKHASLTKAKLTFKVQEGSKLDYPDKSFDRLIATHVLEHIYQPQIALKEWRRVLKPGGLLSILIPTDPGLAWRLGRSLGPRRNAKALGIPYDYIMAREHVNSCNNLVSLLRYYFKNASETWWPLRVPAIDLNLFFAFHATIEKS